MERSRCGLRGASSFVGIATALALAAAGLASDPPVIRTIAGGGALGDGGPAVGAYLGSPGGGLAMVALDASGNLFTTSNDAGVARVRRVDAVTRRISTHAGSGALGPPAENVPAKTANLSATGLGSPGVAVDGSGNVFVVTDGARRVRRIDAATGLIATVAGTGASGNTGDGGPATSATFTRISGVALDSAGNLFVADLSAHRVRRVDAVTGIVAAYAGTGTRGFSGDNGPAVSADLWFPQGLAVDGSGDLYVWDTGNSRIRRVHAGVIATVAGNGVGGFGGDGGPATSANLNGAAGLAVDSSGRIYISDTGNHRVRRVSAAGTITTIAGTGTRASAGDFGLAVSASLTPGGIAVDAAGNVYVGDSGVYTNQRVRRVDAATGVITTYAGGWGLAGDGGAATSATMSPLAVATDANGNLLVVDHFARTVRRRAQR
jgi:sugar lactone lactonase YvrE